MATGEGASPVREAPLPQTDARSQETLAHQPPTPIRGLEPAAWCTDASSRLQDRFRSLDPDGASVVRTLVYSAGGKPGLPGGVAGGRPCLASPPRSAAERVVTMTLNKREPPRQRGRHKSALQSWRRVRNAVNERIDTHRSKRRVSSREGKFPCQDGGSQLTARCSRWGPQTVVRHQLDCPRVGKTVEGNMCVGAERRQMILMWGDSEAAANAALSGDADVNVDIIRRSERGRPRE